MSKRLCVVSLSAQFYNIRFVLVIQLLLNRDSPRTVRFNIGFNHSAACGVLEHDGVVVAFQKKAKDLTVLSSHATITLVLHNLPFLFLFAITLLLVYGVICLLGLQLAYKLCVVFFSLQLACIKIKMLVYFLKMFSVH